MFNVQVTQRLDEMETISLENDAESSFLTLMDLMAEVWEASFSAMRNIRLLIAMMSSYMARCGKVQCDTRRMREGQEMKRILTEFYSSWVTKGPMDAVCTKREMQSFVRCLAPKELHAQLVKGIMIEETFNEWVDEYQRHVGTLEVDSVIAAMGDEAEECDGLDSLFESVVEQGAEPISQNVTRFQNGRLHIVRTPGEIDSQLVRVQVYNVGDIKNVEKRNWWRRATLRAQFLYSSAKTDLKQQALHRLLDAVASDLRSVPGVVRETRDLFNSEDAYSESANGKRKLDDVATTSGSYAKRSQSH